MLRLAALPETPKQWSRAISWAVLALGGLAVFLHTLYYAWVSEDAYITFRVVDNAVNGYGLRWNIDERVQAYTNPLWMLLHIPFYAVFGHMFLLTIAISAVCATLAAWVLIRSAQASPWHIMVLVLMPLYGSRIFFNHAINGLEEPLSMLLVAGFWHGMLRSPGRLCPLVLWASLAMCNRLDNAMLLLPGLAWVAWQCWKQKTPLPRVFLAAFPLWGWLGFSLLYYGFPFPNTKYAKLNTGISTQEYLQAGLYYFENLNVFDSFSCFIVFAALFAGCLQVVLLYDNRRQHSGLRLPLPAVLMAAGILLHMVYVVCVGGDFMAGRFFSVTFFQALMQLYVLLAPVTGFWLVSVAALLLWQWQARVDYTHPYDSPYCIVDARRAAGNMLSHLTVEPQDDAASNPSFRVENGRILAQKGHNTYCPALNSDRVILTSRIGVWGFFCGPKLHIIDGLALSDALLARLPSHQKNWCSGHFYRNIPMGYVHARRTNDTSYMQKDLREYYEKLRLVTSGDLFDPQRLRAIWGFLTGEYEELRQRYIEQSYLD